MRKVTLLFSLLSLTIPCHAVDQVVRSGETSTIPIDLLNDGDRAIVEEGGVLTTDGASAITVNDDNQTALNQGTISTINNNNHGIHNNGKDNAVITNSGRISTTGSTANGIFNDGGVNAVITNSGLISTT
ncbi:MAG: hypothetical protein K1000chlam4_01023, partial [Chlamydiae bacterium]|nr:hypothetical protein [Chlamydiota bacterium]